MHDRFRGKTWIYWAQLIICSGMGSFSILFGSLFWTGAMKDANGEVRPDAGPPMVIIGCVLVAVGVLALFNILGRIAPIVRCYRDGIECNLVGATSLEGIPLIPGMFRVAWAILSLQGFRSQRVRILWSQFAGAHVGGFPMAYVLTLSGTVTNVKTGRVTHAVAFKQVALTDHPQRVADVLNRFALSVGERGSLPQWPPAVP